MANNDINNPLGHVDKRTGRGSTGTTNQNSEYANFATVGAKRARLTTLAAASYTTARLDAMTENDMDYALRLISDAAGI